LTDDREGVLSEVQRLRSALEAAESSREQLVLRERALQASEERYRLVAQAANELLWDVQIETGRVHYSDALRTVFLHDVAADFEYGPVREFWGDNVHPQDRTRVLASYEASLSGTRDQWIEGYRFVPLPRRQ